MYPFSYIYLELNFTYFLLIRNNIFDLHCFTLFSNTRKVCVLASEHVDLHGVPPPSRTWHDIHAPVSILSHFKGKLDMIYF